MEKSDYFKVASSEYPLVHGQVFGFWSDEFVDQLGAAVLAEWRQAVDRMGGRPFLVLAEVSMTAASPRGKALMAQIMSYAKSKQLYRSVEVLPGALVKINIQSSARQSEGGDNFRIVVDTLEAGRQEIQRLQGEL